MFQNFEDFKEKVISLCGGKEAILNLPGGFGRMFMEKLEVGDKSVGEFLLSISKKEFSAKEIVEACETQNYQKIYQEAKRRLEAGQLFDEWKKIQTDYKLSHGRPVVESTETKMHK